MGQGLYSQDRMGNDVAYAMVLAYNSGSSFGSEFAGPEYLNCRVEVPAFCISRLGEVQVRRGFRTSGQKRSGLVSDLSRRKMSGQSRSGCARQAKGGGRVPAGRGMSNRDARTSSASYEDST